jgi:hypothetical protein
VLTTSLERKKDDASDERNDQRDEHHGAGEAGRTRLDQSEGQGG